MKSSGVGLIFLYLPQFGRWYAVCTQRAGTVIGRNALVGAGSVVVRDVLDGKVVVGNPARVIKDVTELTAYEVRERTQGGHTP